MKNAMADAKTSDFSNDELRIKARLEARKAREQDAPVAMQDYHAANQAALDRIPQLRAQRLARDAALQKSARK